MTTKVLWKIQSLWEQFFQKQFQDNEISKNIKEKFFSGGEDNRFHLVMEFSFIHSANPVFSDDNGEYVGLEQLQVIEHNGKLVYLCDNHNKMLVPMYHLYSVLQKPIDIVHIDAHRDDAAFNSEKPTSFELDYLLETTRISDFFDSLSEAKVIALLQRFTDSVSFEEAMVTKCHILSLDIDIFGEEGAFVDLEEKVKTIAKAWEQADIICIATSPGFIDQKFAQEIIQIFTKN